MQRLQESKEQDKNEEENPTVIFMNGADAAAIPQMRTIGLYGSIDEEKCGEVVYLMYTMYNSAKVLEEDGTTSIDPFELVISTWGGDAAEMFSVYDVMRMIKREVPIKTFGIGKVMSAGVLLLAAGTKGERKIGKHCRVMIHSVSSGHAGELHNLKNELEELQVTQEKYIEALAQETDMTKAYIKKLMNKKLNVYLTAQEAVDLGIADIIV